MADLPRYQRRLRPGAQESFGPYIDQELDRISVVLSAFDAAIAAAPEVSFDPSALEAQIAAKADRVTGTTVYTIPRFVDANGGMTGSPLTLTPAGLLSGFSGTSMVADGTYAENGAYVHSNGAANDGRYSFYRSRGTVSAPTAVTNADSLGRLVFYAHDGSTFQTVIRFNGAVEGAVSGGIVPTAFNLSTMDTTGALVQRQRWKPNGDIALTITETGGNIGLGTITPTNKLDIVGSSMRLRSSKTPASATAPGNQGELCWDANYIYVCVASNTWKRAALATW